MFYAGNEGDSDDDVAGNDNVVQIADSVFGSAGGQAASGAGNGEHVNIQGVQ